MVHWYRLQSAGEKSSWLILFHLYKVNVSTPTPPSTLFLGQKVSTYAEKTRILYGKYQSSNPSSIEDRILKEIDVQYTYTYLQVSVLTE